VKVLDLFCGAGGAAMGLHRAWPDAEIIGVDIKPQKHYPFTFVLADAMTFPLEGYDFIWASPPCQGYSIMRNLPWLRHKKYPLLIAPTRERLIASSIPYCIENVPGAKWRKHKPDGMQAGWLCGSMFGLRFFRHRLFETSFFWLQPAHPLHDGIIKSGRMLGDRARQVVVRRNGFRAGFDQPQTSVLVGHPSKKEIERVATAFEIDWMNRDELTQAIPPAYSEFIAKQVPL